MTVPAKGESSSSTYPARLTEGRYVGAAVRFDQLTADPGLRAVVLETCASITPEIHLKWDALQPAADTWRTGPADDLVGFATAHGLAVRGHTLLWDQSTPAWAKERMARTRDWAVVGEYFRSVIGRYSGQITEWDVINEPIDPGARADGLRRNAFLKAYGPSYIERALREAREHAPNAKLVINDYSFDYDNSVEDARRAAFLTLLTRLKRDGVPIDGVGLQAHLDLSKGPLKPEVLLPFLQSIADLGLSISITELDVKEDDRSLSVQDRDRRVADEVERYLDIVCRQSAVKGVTTWGLSDPHSWLQPPGAEGLGLNRGLPYDAALEPKPMRHAIVRSLGGVTSRS